MTATLFGSDIATAAVCAVTRGGATALHRRGRLKGWRGLLAGLLVAAIVCSSGCAGMVGQGAGDIKPSAAVSGDDFIIVAVADTPEPRPAAGAAARAGYSRAAGYGSSDHALALAAGVAGEHGLTEVRAWTIPALRWRCMLYRLPGGQARQTMLAVLASDPRVQLAQPLNEFQTLAAAAAPAPPPGAAGAAYNDPYLSLQSGLARIDAVGAQRVTRGEGVTVAVIDTGVDQQHPDLQGRVTDARDFVGGRAAAPEHHGTQVAGLIGAAANNGIGIVGVAPAARLISLRACWVAPPPAGAGPTAGPASMAPARCNSFTLAQALSAAIAAGADVINLSLGGPRDALLERLTLLAISRGAVVVGAVPASGRREGFPSAVPGVLAVAASEDGVTGSDTLSAPGLRVLTLAAGGSYDFASGSSMAAAHVSGAVALLRALDGGVDAPALLRLLGTGAGTAIDVCRAVQRLRARLPPVCAAPG